MYMYVTQICTIITLWSLDDFVVALYECRPTEKHIMAVLDGKWMDSEVQLVAPFIT